MHTTLPFEERGLCFGLKHRLGDYGKSSGLTNTRQRHLRVAIGSGLIYQVVGNRIKRQFRGYLTEIGFGILALLI